MHQNVMHAQGLKMRLLCTQLKRNRVRKHIICETLTDNDYKNSFNFSVEKNLFIENDVLPYSCQCRWCTTKHAGSTPRDADGADWGSDGSV